jgi:hypothetical protein
MERFTAMVRSFLLVFAALCGVFLSLVSIESLWVHRLVSDLRAQVVGPDGQTPQKILKAGDVAPETTTLLAVGDIAACESREGLSDLMPATFDLLGASSAFLPSEAPANLTAELARNWPDAPIIAVGDTVYGRGTPIEYKHCFEPTWGALKDRILPAPGNHEYGTPGAFGYFDYFGAQAGEERRGWYAVRTAGWLILSLNSEVDASAGSEQSVWLDQQLNAADNACVMAFYHRPAHSLKRRGGNENAILLFDQLQKGGAAVVLNGHNHFYERTRALAADGTIDEARGTVAFTVGTGGKQNSELPMGPTTAAAAFDRIGMLKLDLQKGAYAWAYIDARTKAVLDQGEAACNPERDLEIATN